MPRRDDLEYPPGLPMRFGTGGNGVVDVGGISGMSGLGNGISLNRPTGTYTPISDGRRPSMASPSGFTTFWDQHQQPRNAEVPNKRNPGGSEEGAISFSHAPNLPSLPNHHQPPSPPLSISYSPSADRDAHRFLVSPTIASPSTPNSTSNTPATSNTTRSTLWWGELEPWMDEEYAKQVCGLMGWDSVNIKVPQPPQDPSTGHQANNPGYCFLTFPSPAHAASVLAQVNNGTGVQITMPNSSKPFSLNWASNVAPPFSSSTQMQSDLPLLSNIPNLAGLAALQQPQQAQQQYPKEYSIFVGDLAPETSNSDLVAVFRNPVLGLRNDREPKFIRPFLSCKSAKIMLDPVTGVSRGYGFVRFTDEADQQRALIEMHGLYCLSRPMRISPATAKFKPMAPLEQQLAQQLRYSVTDPAQVQALSQLASIPVTASSVGQTKSVSAPIAAGNNTSTNNVSASSITSSSSANSNGSLASTATAFSSVSSDDIMNQMGYGSSGSTGADTTPKSAASTASQTTADANTRYMISEESWKHHAQARAILGNLIGPNGEQLTSTDPYNTTVFVGGLSPLISEETLRTFFTPFGDIHYVKVPVGKHCGFVQFVRKADAERAIEKMQGFPIGGSRIRLSWGRSQYKAAQAAAQAAQAAALQSQLPVSLQNSLGSLTQEQAVQLLQKLTMQGFLNPPSSMSSAPENVLNNNGSYSSGMLGHNGVESVHQRATAGFYGDEKLRAAHLSSREDLLQPGQNFSDIFQNYDVFSASQEGRQSSFSPFSPDPMNLYSSVNNPSANPFSHSQLASLSTESILKERRDSYSTRSPVSAGPEGKTFPPFGSLNSTSSEDGNGRNGMDRLSPTSARSPSASSRYQLFQGTSPIGSGREGSPPNLNIGNGRIPVPISRPSSGQAPGSGGLSAIGAGGLSQMGSGRGSVVANVPSLGGYEAVHDLNGTMAKLDLSEREKYARPWASKSPAASSESSGTSVQFQLSMDDGSSASAIDERRGSQ
ncbi:hypothetical protein K435DRAFT_962498 [Dendrothele bispora CBS 962.96]|uniref:RRM domain-containing protein n=1 Tax=Dendrothele bispora (strain CBS 962.96) TaxID=1314807 RepID=A0A4S8ML40_DENBC|nr:hypothetical protein K435DRAFT_962498 [Dendrothele bispora CBS 962.96]